MILRADRSGFMSFSSAVAATMLAAVFCGQAIASDWSWVNPLPQGNDLRDIWCAAPNDIWAVGDTGALLHYNGTAWSIVPADPNYYFRGVWGTGPADVFAVGYINTQGAILHYDGSAWSIMPAGTTNALFDVWGTGPNDVFAVGSAGAIVHYNGSVWSAMTSGTTKRLCAVWASGPNDVWAVGEDSTLAHYDGVAWTTTTGSTWTDYTGIWGTGPNNVYVAETYSYYLSGYHYAADVMRFDGTSWSYPYSKMDYTTQGIWVADANNVFLPLTDSGYPPLLARFNGSTWSTVSMPLDATGIHGTASNNVYTVGEDGAILRYNGSSWSEVSSGPRSTFKAVWGSGLTRAFAVGYDGKIARYNGASWTSMTSGTTNGLAGVWGSGSNDVFAVGDSGTILHCNGSAWSAMSSGTTRSLSDVWGNGPNDVLAVGTSNTILHYDGATWSALSAGATGSFRAIWGSGPNDVFVVGSAGVAYHYDGSTWLPMSTGVSVSLEDVWGSGPNDVFAVGPNTIVHYDGSSWSSVTTGTPVALESVWGSGPNDVFAVGGYGTGIALHYDGASWTLLPRATLNYLYGVWGAGPCDVFVVGEGGTVLHYGGGDPGQSVLVNGGFEVPLETTGGWPTGFGYWRGDYSEIVTADNGIAPSEGDRMLKFIATSGPNAPASTGASQVVQLVDLRGLSAQIAEGYTHARFRARFNRVTGDAQTDTRFTTDLFAYAGEPNSFPTQFNQSTHLGRGRGAVISDGDPNTWQSATAELTLPVGTDFIAIVAAAEENIYNDTTEPEFDGHYCDAVTLEVFRSEHVLTLSVVNGSWGSVEAEPNLSTYPAGTPVTLTATPIEGKYFRHWEVYDPCHPNDANYVTYDANETTTIVMNADRQVTAVFKCSSGVEQMLLLAIVGLCVLGFVARWRRQRR